MASLDELKYFLCVAKTSNVSRASELIGISQPALSHALKRLEDQLGTKLLLREKTGVRLTRAGEQFAIQSKELIDKWEELSNSVRTIDESVSGHYKIGCHPSVAIYSLPLFLKDLAVSHPNLHFSLHHGMSREISADVISWKIDFGIVINPPEHPDLVIKDLGGDEITLWINPNEDVPDVLICDANRFQTADILKQLARRKIKFARQIESSNLEVIYALTVAGCGIGILPTRVAKGRPESPLEHFGERRAKFKDRLCLIYRSEAHKNASGRAIIGAISRGKF